MLNILMYSFLLYCQLILVILTLFLYYFDFIVVIKKKKLKTNILAWP